MLFGGFTVLAVGSRSFPPTSYAATSTAAHVANDITGIALLAAAAITAIVRPRGSIAPLTAAIGVAWLAPDWVGWDQGLPAGRSVALVVAPLLLPFVAHLVLAYPTGRVDSRLARVFVVVAYGAAVAVGVGLALVRDPFLDLHCWANCTDNVFLVRSELELSRLLDRTWLRAAAVIGVLAAAAGVWRIARATPVARRSIWFVVVPAGAAALSITSYAVLLLPDRAEDPTDASFRAVFFVRAGLLLATAIGVAWGVWRIERTQRAVTRLADELGTAPPPGSLAPALARSLGDDRLAVAYWLPSTGRYVDACGRPVDPRPGRDQASTAIVRNGRPVAIVVHDRALTTRRPRSALPPGWPSTTNGCAPRSSPSSATSARARARIVATADTTRRRLERDLHDGAQQRLLAASYELRLACSAATAAGDTDLADALTIASEQAQLALTELRELAHGIYPAILTEAGLDPALRSLAEKAPLPVEIGDVVTGRYPADVETAAYVVVATTMDTASRRSATYVAVRIAEVDHHLTVEVRSDEPEPDLDVDLTDRVGALGGRLTVDADTVRAEIPCES